ncbi:hypothetical protein SRRS_38820 [Sporomusa rhizae]
MGTGTLSRQLNTKLYRLFATGLGYLVELLENRFD